MTKKDPSEALLCRRSRASLLLKRVFDIVTALLALILLCWLFLLIAVLIRLEDKGPVIYRHMRLGRGGKPIAVYKFRSMKNGADRLEDFLSPEELEEYHREFKLDHDPRITRIGNFLRKSSLDELPQLVNILKGEMSMVGPRPIVEEELKYYTPNELAMFQSVRPGLTGYWQAYARNNATYESRARQRMELYYIEHCSILLDLKILFRTVVSVLKQDGAK